MPGDAGDDLGPDPPAVPGGAEADVDPRVAVTRLELLGELHEPGDHAAEEDRPANRPGVVVGKLGLGVAPPAPDLGRVIDAQELGDVSRPQGAERELGHARRRYCRTKCGHGAPAGRSPGRGRASGTGAARPPPRGWGGGATRSPGSDRWRLGQRRATARRDPPPGASRLLLHADAPDSTPRRGSAGGLWAQRTAMRRMRRSESAAPGPPPGTPGVKCAHQPHKALRVARGATKPGRRRHRQSPRSPPGAEPSSPHPG
jgi:hypothetical protein